MTNLTKTLNRRITIQTPISGQDSAGQPLAGWAVFDEVWANIRYGSGSESIKADSQSSETKASIRIRYRLDLNTSMRVLYKSTIFQIKACLPDETSREHLDLVCEVIK